MSEASGAKMTSGTTRGTGQAGTQSTCLNTRVHSTDEGGTITEAHASSIGAHPGPVVSRLVTVAGLAVVVAAIITFNVMKRR